MEISVVLHADAGAGEEVARELGPGPGERERSDCHHESLRALSAPVDLQTHLLESHRAAIGLQRANALGRLRRAAATARALARNDLFGDFVAGHLVEIRELIRSEQRLAPLGDVQVLLGGRGFDLILNKSGLERGDVASFFFDLLEQAPRLLGNRGGQVLDVVRSAGRVAYLIEMRLFLEQQLHVTRDAGREVGRFLVNCVERQHLDRVNAGNRRAHRFGRAAQHVDVGVVDGHVPPRGHGMREHFGGTLA